MHLSHQPTGQAELLLPISHDFVHHFTVSERSINFVRRGETQGDIYQISLSDWSPPLN